MPRGIPNAKRDDSGMRYTTFHVPLASVLHYHPAPLYTMARFRADLTQNIWDLPI